MNWIDPLGLVNKKPDGACCSTPNNLTPYGTTLEVELNSIRNLGTTPSWVRNPSLGERSLTQEKYKSLMTQYRNKGDQLQLDLDTTIAQQDYVYRAAKLKDIENYRAANSISGRGGAPTYMSTDYVGLDPKVIMDKAQVSEYVIDKVELDGFAKKKRRNKDYAKAFNKLNEEKGLEYIEETYGNTPTRRGTFSSKSGVAAPNHKDSGGNPIYVWHHHEDMRTMVTLDYKIHNEFGHLGGVSNTNNLLN